ncbi:MAG: RagB/SusD family nutrient uptake outer membrane protein [Ekhidna sp.]|nr:RagB/SusD family nutrient uptake outer membrane protein [Ekhidna sp.]
MKKIAGLYIAAGLFILGSCADKLDIEPEGILTDEQVFNNTGTAEKVLAGVYYNYLETVVGARYMYGDITTQNIITSTDQFVNQFIAPVLGTGENFWSDYYRTINLANNVITKVAEIGTYEPEIMEQHIAEAKFLRAICYFDLLKLYGDGALTGNMDGLGLPLQLKGYDGTEIDDFIPRNTNGEVYDQIIKDLTEARSNLPTVHGSLTSTASRATVGGVDALLSRVYLYLEDYENAAQSAASVLDGGQYDLETELRTLYPTDPNVIVQALTEEDIFAMPISSNQAPNFTAATNRGINNIFYITSITRNVSQDLIDEFEAGDQRKNQLIVEGWDLVGNVKEAFDQMGNPIGSGNYTTFKFGPDQKDNVAIIRLAEVYLNRAEALVHTLNAVNLESVRLLNSVRVRANPIATPFTTNDFNSTQELLDRILLERRLELMFESHHRYDLIRTGRKEGLQDPDISNDLLVLPIPVSEIELSDGILQQNIGYQ